MIVFACPACGQKLQTRDELAGQRGKCPHCKRLLTFPRNHAAAASPAEPVFDLDQPSLLSAARAPAVQAVANATEQKTLLPEDSAPAMLAPAPPPFAAAVSPEL